MYSTDSWSQHSPIGADEFRQSIYLSLCTCSDYWIAQPLRELYSGLFGVSCFVIFP